MNINKDTVVFTRHELHTLGVPDRMEAVLKLTEVLELDPDATGIEPQARRELITRLRARVYGGLHRKLDRLHDECMMRLHHFGDRDRIARMIDNIKDGLTK